jgi:PAS domain S-box-containing protein
MDVKKTEKQSTKTVVNTTKLVHYSLMLSIAWTIVIILFATWNVYQTKQTTRALANKEARSHFNKDQAFRFWATTHGGVYVSTNERTPPNPHLKHVPERDIISPSGKKLTLMNPAYMLRQVMEEFSKSYGVKGRIISLKPFRTQNTPDKWEKSALKAFESGVKEVSELVDIKGEPYMRLIQPMMTKKGCLKCHGFQGYKVGDVRGGVSISVPMSSYLSQEGREIRQLIISYVLIWLFGVGVIYSGFRGLRHRIAERNQAVIALHESEQKLSATLNSIGDAVISTDIKGHVAGMNPVAENLTGWIESEALGQPLSEVFHIVNVTTRESVENPHEKVLCKGDIVELADHTVLISRGGTEFQIADSGAPIHRNGGVVQGVVLVFRDVTQEYHMEKELAESETKYRTMMDSMKEPIYICSSDDTVEYMNKAMIKRTGRDATGEKCFFALHDLEEQCSWCMHDKILKKEYFELNIVSPKDNRSYHVSHSPLIHVDGSISKLTVFRDMTEMLKMESQLRQAQKMESIGTLAGGIAHDFNNILFPIMGHSEMLIDEVAGDSNLKPGLIEIFNGAQRAKDLVQQILTFSRQREQKLKPLKIQAVVKEALKLIRSSLPATIEINLDIQEDCGLIMADPTQIHQIIMNLITNAYHAMEETGGCLDITIRKIELSINELIDSTMEPGAYVCLTVADTGMGMDKSITDRIFDPYFTTKKEGKGTGLGLSVIHGIVKSHEGHISVYSEPGKGTEFHVYLPETQSQADTQAMKAFLPLEKGSEKILLVDDKQEIVSIIAKMLDKLGYHVTSRISGIEAFEAFCADPYSFDLVITDLTMPKITGDKLAGKIMKIRPDIPVILCSGFSEMMSKKKTKSLGIKGFLMKPVLMNDLSHKIREVLDKNKN